MKPVVYLLCVVAVLTSPGFAKGDDPGYFLSWKQKKELMAFGRIQDAAGTWYDVWICPGYALPSRYAADHLKKAGADFHEYIEADKYHLLKEGSKTCLVWAFEDCGLGFTLKGIPRAWNRHLAVAHKRTQQRVFGWWLAYPWACMESAVETAFRGAVGTVGTIGGTVSGVAVVPAYHALDSAVSGLWNLGVNTIVVPSIGVIWNTLVGPPLALVGQKPSESRVDGFWVTIVRPDHVAVSRRLSEKEIRVVGEWGLVLLKETKPFEEKLKKINADAQEKESQLRRELQQTRTNAAEKRVALQKEERAHVQQVIGTNHISEITLGPGSLRGHLKENQSKIRRYLIDRGLSQEDVESVLRLLKRYAAPYAVGPSSTRKKTDPLQRGVEVIGESAEDMLK